MNISEKWKRTVLAAYQFGPQEMESLSQAAKCLDRITEAEESIKKFGLVIESSKGEVKANPAAKIEHDQRKLFNALCKDLKIYGGIRAEQKSKKTMLEQKGFAHV
jgi:phage terminase small subunit